MALFLVGKLTSTREHCVDIVRCSTVFYSGSITVIDFFCVVVIELTLLLWQYQYIDIQWELQSWMAHIPSLLIATMTQSQRIGDICSVKPSQWACRYKSTVHLYAEWWVQVLSFIYSTETLWNRRNWCVCVCLSVCVRVCFHVCVYFMYAWWWHDIRL